jgi:hypothetical protein
MADQDWFLLIILAVGGWILYSAGKTYLAGAAQSDPTLEFEARRWIRNHPKTRAGKGSPLAWHARFMSAERAIEFVDRLYQGGAAEVQIDRDSLNSSWDASLGRHVLRPDAEANALLILLPNEAQQHGILVILDDEVRTGSGTPRLQRHFEAGQLGPLEPGQEVVRLSWPAHRTVI